MKRYSRSADRSAINALVAVLVIVILAVACVGAFVLLSGDSDDKIEDTRTLAPGTAMNYDVNGIGSGPTPDLRGTIAIKIVAQNSDQYLTEYTYDLYTLFLTSHIPVLNEVEYTLIDKESKEEYTVIGEEKISTIDGEKTVIVLEQIEGPVVTRSYVDTTSGTEYRISLESGSMSFIADLTSQEIVLQDSYEASTAIGNNITYKVTGKEGSITYSGISVTEIVAESTEGYWQKVTVSLSGEPAIETYSLIEDNDNDPQFVGYDHIETVYGWKDVVKQTWTNDEGLIYLTYADPTIGLTYKIEIKDKEISPTVFITMELESINSGGSGSGIIS
jgi:hypothetical protein